VIAIAAAAEKLRWWRRLLPSVRLLLVDTWLLLSMEERNLNIALWNARGLNNPARRTSIRAAITESRAAIVCISESKLQVVSPYIVVECFGPGFDRFAYLPSLGSAEGVLVVWRSEVVTVHAQRTDCFLVSILLSTEGGQTLWLTAVYGPCSLPLKPGFLDELRFLRGVCTGPWAVADDFNLILEAHDKNNTNVNRRSMTMFRRAVKDLELKESNLLGRRFTWSNERATPTLERIDRWFGSVVWVGGMGCLAPFRLSLGCPLRFPTMLPS
jgi:hypothetical protein